MAIWSWFLENQTKFSFYGILIIEILVNSLCFAWADSLLGDFLEGSIGKSKARKLRKQQKLRVKLLMNYITPVLRRHQKTFRKYLRLYHAWLFSRIVPLGMIISPSRLIKEIKRSFFRERSISGMSVTSDASLTRNSMASTLESNI